MSDPLLEFLGLIDPLSEDDLGDKWKLTDGILYYDAPFLNGLVDILITLPLDFSLCGTDLHSGLLYFGVRELYGLGPYLFFGLVNPLSPFTSSSLNALDLCLIAYSSI